jgi:peptidylprolyl isomerase
LRSRNLSREKLHTLGAMTNRPFLGILFLASVAAAQTGAPAHHTPGGTAAHHEAAGGCVTPPEMSPKIPALPAGAPCAKALYTLTRTPTVKLDYASPLVSSAVREELGEGPERFSLDYVDTKLGSGPPVQQHECLSVQYTGWLTSGTKFDSSHDHPGGEPITFFYGAHHVIPGWDTGFEGMHIGGQRRLFIPWQLGYGEAGRQVIPPKADLIFDVEAVSQTPPHEGGPPGSECARAPEPRPSHGPAGGAPDSNGKPLGVNPHPSTTPPPTQPH